MPPLYACLLLLIGSRFLTAPITAQQPASEQPEAETLPAVITNYLDWLELLSSLPTKVTPRSYSIAQHYQQALEPDRLKSMLAKFEMPTYSCRYPTLDGIVHDTWRYSGATSQLLTRQVTLGNEYWQLSNHGAEMQLVRQYVPTVKHAESAFTLIGEPGGVPLHKLRSSSAYSITGTTSQYQVINHHKDGSLHHIMTLEFSDSQPFPRVAVLLNAEGRQVDRYSYTPMADSADFPIPREIAREWYSPDSPIDAPPALVQRYEVAVLDSMSSLEGELQGCNVLQYIDHINPMHATYFRSGLAYEYLSAPTLVRASGFVIVFEGWRSLMRISLLAISFVLLVSAHYLSGRAKTRMWTGLLLCVPFAIYASYSFMRNSEGLRIASVQGPDSDMAHVQGTRKPMPPSAIAASIGSGWDDYSSDAQNCGEWALLGLSMATKDSTMLKYSADQLVSHSSGYMKLKEVIDVLHKSKFKAMALEGFNVPLDYKGHPILVLLRSEHGDHWEAIEKTVSGEYLSLTPVKPVPVSGAVLASAAVLTIIPASPEAKLLTVDSIAAAALVALGLLILLVQGYVRRQEK